ncbi:hypothetical protein B0T19DRAFT_268323 [Cercophora scortea]|uniref:Uncharacterized protein n=1 Tax=Cercophora scortea TaxID=314031 RepID=A0AAE0M4V0_9PEZI|nr:hypothetical protein B0T19DRAFT_268323 [Cercophora scortea]
MSLLSMAIQPMLALVVGSSLLIGLLHYIAAKVVGSTLLPSGSGHISYPSLLTDSLFIAPLNLYAPRQAAGSITEIDLDWRDTCANVSFSISAWPLPVTSVDAPSPFSVGISSWHIIASATPELRAMTVDTTCASATQRLQAMSRLCSITRRSLRKLVARRSRLGKHNNAQSGGRVVPWRQSSHVVSQAVDVGGSDACHCFPFHSPGDTPRCFGLVGLVRCRVLEDRCSCLGCRSTKGAFEAMMAVLNRQAAARRDGLCHRLPGAIVAPFLVGSINTRHKTLHATSVLPYHQRSSPGPCADIGVLFGPPLKTERDQLRFAYYCSTTSLVGTQPAQEPMRLWRDGAHDESQIASAASYPHPSKPLPLHALPVWRSCPRLFSIDSSYGPRLARPSQRHSIIWLPGFISTASYPRHSLHSLAIYSSSLSSIPFFHNAHCPYRLGFRRDIYHVERVRFSLVYLSYDLGGSECCHILLFGAVCWGLDT